MKNTFIYSFCGLFITSVAVARTLYMDVGTNSQCGGFCLVNPGDGACCPTGSVVTKLNTQSSDSSTKTVEGFYLDGVKLADYDGTLRTLSADEIASIRASAGTELSTGTAAQLTKQEYNKDTTQYVVFGENGEFTEYTEPQKSGTFCDHARIILHNNDGTSASQTVYYKYGAGYFTDPARTNPFNPASAKITRNGYTLRGWFTSTWNSSTTDKSSYIANYTPYRTIGHAFIPWTNTVTAPVSSSDTLSWPGNTKAFSVISCPSDGNQQSNYPKVELYAGWAKNCENDAYCELYISGQTPVTTLHNGYVRNTAGGTRSWMLDKTSIYGDWLPGGVDYARKEYCPSGTTQTVESTATITLSYPYPSTNNPVTQTLNTNKLGCESTTPTTPTKIKLVYHGTGVTVYDNCNIGGSNTITIKDKISGQAITAFAYTANGAPVFNAGDTVSCSVGSGGFTQYTTDVEYYVVDMYPVAGATQTTFTIKYMVTLPGEQTTGEGGLTISPICTNTQTCTEGASVTLKSALTCSTGTVNISKWTKAGGGDISGFNTTCSESALGTATNGTITLTGTIGGGTNPFVCQQTGFIAPTNGKVEYNSQSGETCNYTVSCNSGYTMSPTNGTVTCTGESNCTVAKLNQQFANYSCTAQTPAVTCPNASEFDNVIRPNITVIPGEHTSTTCFYTLTCPPDYTLSGEGQITCSSTNSCKNKVAQGNCICPDAPPVDNGMITKSSGATCSYLLTCDAGYGIPDTDMDPEYRCNGNNCTSASVNNWANGLECRKYIACPSPNSIDHGNIAIEFIHNGTACKYTINCDAPAYVCDANVEHCTNGFTCESVEACNAWLSTTRSSTCVFECPSKSYLESKLPHMNVQGLLTTNPSHDCQYTLGTCTHCYERAHTGAGTLYCDGAECNGSSWYSAADSCTWVGGDGCAAQ